MYLQRCARPASTPLWKNIISLRYAGSPAIVANAHAWLQELYFWQTSQSAFLHSVVIFVKYRTQGFHPYDIAKFHRQLQEQLCIRVLAATAGGAQLRGRGRRARPPFSS